MGNRLFVGNLAYTTDQRSLREALVDLGLDVTEAVVVYDRETSRSKGFGFVELATAEDMKRALDEADGLSVDGREIRVSEAHERERRPSAPNGNGGARRGGYDQGARGNGSRGSNGGGGGKSPQRVDSRTDKFGRYQND